MGTLRDEFGRMRGAADNFTKLQADALKELREDSKHLTSEVSQIWHFLQALLTKVNDLTPQIKVKQEPPYVPSRRHHSLVVTFLCFDFVMLER